MAKGLSEEAKRELREKLIEGANQQADALIALYESIYASIPDELNGGQADKFVESLVALSSTSVVDAVEAQRKAAETTLRDKDKMGKLIKEAMQRGEKEKANE